MNIPESLYRSSLLYLTTVGSRTGLPRRVELWFAYQDGKIYLLGHRRSHWVHNLEASPQVTVEVRGRRLEGTARFADQMWEFAYDLFRKKYGQNEVDYWYGRSRKNRRTIEITLTYAIAANS